MKFFLFALVVFLSGCTLPETGHIPAVSPFDIKKYCGTWYEIARLPNWFEKELTQVTAQYSLCPDGTVEVLNSGFRNGKYKSIRGTARAVKTDHGELEVSFQWPFWGAYRIIYLNKDYSVAVVCGKHFGFLWILARTPKLPDGELKSIIDSLHLLGFNTGKLEFPQQKSGSIVNDTAAL